MTPEERAIVTSTLEEAVRELFAAYGVPCEMVEPTDDVAGAELGSIVGFKGGNVRGGLALVAPADLVAKTHPVPVDADGRTDLELRDWSAELANQLVGRFKNKLHARAIPLEVGTPVCLRGTMIRLTFPPDADGVALAFSADDAAFRVYLDCAFALAAQPTVSSDVLAEGEVVLF